MRSLNRFAALALVASFLLASPAAAQFFGKNKVAYDTFKWNVYRSPHFDVHYYEAEEPFLEEVVSYAESAYLHISKELDHELTIRVPLIVYKTHQEFTQTNITLAELPEGVEAFAEPIQNRMVLPIDLPPEELYALIAHELTHIFEYSIFYDGYLGRAIRSRPPTWLFEGLASYLGDDENNIDRMVIRDAVVNNFLPPIQSLDFLSYLAYRFGHAVFDFIEQEHGKEGLRNFIYEYRKHLLSGNLSKAVKDTFGYDMDEFNRRFNRYLRKKYFPVLLEKKSPDDYGRQIGLRKGFVQYPTFGPALSPSGELVAALAAPKMEIDLVVLSAEDGRTIRNLTKGWTSKYQNIVAESFAGKRDVGWSPNSDMVAVFVKKENRRPLWVFDALSGKVTHRVDLGDLYETASPAFSHDGTKVAFEGNLHGVVDLFEYDLETQEIRNLTQDEFFDANPWYSDDGGTLLYNRRIGEHWKIMQVDVRDPTRKTQITFGPHSDIQPSYSRDGQWIYFASDQDPNGVFNIYSLDLTDGTVKQWTDVVGGCFSPVEIVDREGERVVVFTSFFTGSFKLYRMPLEEPVRDISMESRMTDLVEAEPFQPPLELSLDDDEKRPYKLKWDIDTPSITLGVTDDGRLLSSGQFTFSDLLGDHRFQILASTVSTYANLAGIYTNLKRRYNWGASIYDFRDFYLSSSSAGVTSDQVQRSTGLNGFIDYPFNRYYRATGSVGLLDRSQDVIVGYDADGQPLFTRIEERFATVSGGIVGDTVRFQNFGPFQGHRFRFGTTYGYNLGGVPGDLLDITFDYRSYKQITRRSTLAWRFTSLFSEGGRQTVYTVGGLNQLRGFQFREYIGSRVAWTNLEYRFPLINSIGTGIGTFGPVRGVLFVNAGAAVFQDEEWWDPRLGEIRGQRSGEIVPFSCWDSENSRLQDCRVSFGWGFSFVFVGLQFNWSFAHAMPWTQYIPSQQGNPFSPLEKTELKPEGGRMDFFIIYDW